MPAVSKHSFLKQGIVGLKQGIAGLKQGMVGALFAALTVLSRPDLPGAAELVMFEEPGCVWCVAWSEEIGRVYDKTEEGRRAPLRRVDKTEAWPSDLREVAPVVYSPTFVLVERGRELGRITGYPGEDFFWPLLAKMLQRLEPEGKRCGEGETKAQKHPEENQWEEEWEARQC